MSITSILQDVGKGLTKPAAFVIALFTKTSAVIKVLQTVGPSTIAALLAVFYDVVNFFTNASASVLADLQAGNFQGALNDMLSPTTKNLLASVIKDFKNAETQVVNDFKALGIAVKDADPAATTEPLTPAIPAAAAKAVTGVTTA